MKKFIILTLLLLNFSILTESAKKISQTNTKNSVDTQKIEEEARKKAKQSQGKIYKILQNEFVENIFEELWEDYSIPKYKGRK